MRLKTAIWVKAYLRRCAVEGLPAVVVRHGDDDAGAVFIKVSRLDGTSQLFVPAPAGLAEGDFERRWIADLRLAAAADDAVDERLSREQNFDSDLWIVEVEARDGRHLLDDWLMAE